MNSCELIGCRMARGGVCKKGEYLNCQYPARKDVADLLITQLENTKETLEYYRDNMSWEFDKKMLTEVSETLDIFYNTEI